MFCGVCRNPHADISKSSAVQKLLFPGAEGSAMSLVRLLGFRTLGCGCVIGQYRELATSRELTYVEEKGVRCEMHGHRRNHTIHAERLSGSPVFAAAKAS
jgi:hypothetical protein